MKYSVAKSSFIQAWGTLGSSWGINKAMAQIHALLLISPVSLSTEEIMDELKMSRGNVNMNVRALIDWGVVEKELKTGERKEYFKSEKDVWELARRISRERKKREFEPMLRILEQVSKVEGKDNHTREFKAMTKELYDFTHKLDGILEKFAESDKNWFYKMLMKV